MEEVMSSSLQGFVVKRIWIHGDHECKKLVWESPFIPSHLTFKKLQISLNQSPNKQIINHNYLFIITFQYLEFWDVTICKICSHICSIACLHQPAILGLFALITCSWPNTLTELVNDLNTKGCCSGAFSNS